MKRFVSLLLATVVAVAPTSSFAWGNAGHRMIGEAAARALPAEVPAFLRTPQAIADISEYSREPDRLKGSGKVHDHHNDAAHFVDVEDDGRILGGPTLATLPPTIAEYEAAITAAGQDMWKAGYLPYSIVDRWQQLTKSFAYWRALKAAEANPKWKANRTFFAADRRRREAQILQTIGELSHFVGDGSQPLHVTAHYNGWGEYPNPNGYTTNRIHSMFEGALVKTNVRPQTVAAGMAPMRLCDCPIEQRTVAYLTAGAKMVEPLYQLEKAGGLKQGDPRGPEFATRQMSIGASELRDLVVEAWRASAKQTVGWRPVSVADVEAGAVDPYAALYGVD